MIITNKYVTKIMEKIYKRKKNYHELTLEFSRGYLDDEQLWESFVTQYFRELRQMVDDMEAEELRNLEKITSEHKTSKRASPKPESPEL